MQIADLVKASLVDYPGLIAAVVFTQGCNLRCGYCHNYNLLPLKKKGACLPVAGVLDLFLKKRRNLLDGVVISGGEPTIQDGLIPFIEQVKNLGYQVKLDTNGTAPGVLRELLAQNLLDYVAMDVKAPPERYAEICGSPVNLKALEESIRLLQEAPVQYELRTTLAPGLKLEDLRHMMAWIGGQPPLTLQRYRETPGPSGVPLTPDPSDHEIAAQFKAEFEFCQLRGFS
ncbi:MAG: anaerobic ribonucleoside-triphosphate reductase activating protein [Bacillota bacterium]|jgi:pyruvate formate lyase activating enzyme